MSDNQNSNQTNAFRGIENLDEYTQQEIIANAQAEVDKVNSATARQIEQAKEQECSKRIAEEIAAMGHITQDQRARVIGKWHKRMGLYEYGQGGSR